jgi:hypothetical protein
MRPLYLTYPVVLFMGVACASRSSDDPRLAAHIADFCEIFGANEDDLVEGGYVDAEAAFCDLWEEGKVTDQQFSAMCYMDYEGRNAIVDVQALCPLFIEPETEVTTDFTTGHAYAQAEATGPDCDSPGSDLHTICTGECASGNLFIYRGYSLHGTIDFYDPVSEQFLGRTLQGDFVIPPCCAIWYWPRRVECVEPVVTEVLCGTRIEVGDTLYFFDNRPW